MSAPAQILRNWYEQRPINQGYLDSSVMGRLEQSITRGGGGGVDRRIF
jgi:hypothetical protein